MAGISSPLVSSRMRGVFVNNTAAWAAYGEQMWSDMMQALLKKPTHLRIMGVDSEWFRNSPLAVVQLATASHCFVLHLSYFDDRRLPDSVKGALCDPGIIKCGVGINGDVSRLQKEQNITIQSVLDVGQYSVMLGLHDAPQSNLKVLAANVASLDIEKNKYISRSNWELTLSDKQINYAAEDALASFMVGEAIMRTVNGDKPIADTNFNIPQWLKSSAVIAAQTFKSAQRERAKEARDQMKKEARIANPENTSSPLASQLGGGARVTVLDKNGHFLFECSPGRAKFYVMEKNLAKITKRVKGNPRKATEIQLLFDPKVKTRLCMYDTLGVCELNGHCPFAHGVDELQPESRALLTSAEPSCACCLGTKGLLRHSVTPPSFRKYLPYPYNHPADGDFEPVCSQCNSVLRHYYDNEISKCYEEAGAADRELFNITAVAKCASYSRLLSDDSKLTTIPMTRQDELKDFIRSNWERTYFQDFYPDFPVSQPMELTKDFLTRLGKIVPGEVRAKVTISILVGKDKEKAEAFVQRWKGFCFQTCGMIAKDSNHMTPEDWKIYRAQNGLSEEDDGDHEKKREDEANGTTESANVDTA